MRPINYSSLLTAYKDMVHSSSVCFLSRDHLFPVMWRGPHFYTALNYPIPATASQVMGQRPTREFICSWHSRQNGWWFASISFASQVPWKSSGITQDSSLVTSQLSFYEFRIYSFPVVLKATLSHRFYCRSYTWSASKVF